jgi:O-antigen ligase
MIYTPTLPRQLVRGFMVENELILCLFALAPAFLVNLWPVPAGALILLFVLRSNLPSEKLIAAGGLAAVAALLGTQADPGLAAGLVWWVLVLLLTVGSLQTINRETAIYAILIAASIHAVYGPISSGVRWSGYLGNPNVYGSFLAICLPLAVARRSWLFTAVISGGLILSGSVGGALAAGVGLAVLALQTSRVRSFLRRNWKLAAAGIVAVVVIAAAWPDVARRWDNRSNRFILWELAATQAISAPLAGTGPGSTPILWKSWGSAMAFNRAIPTGTHQMIGAAWWASYSHAHNLYLHVLAETGIVGLLALVMVAIYVVYNVRGPALAGLAGLAAHGLVDATALHPVIAVLAAMLIGIGSQRETHPARMGIILAGLLAVLSPVAGELLAALY